MQRPGPWSFFMLALIVMSALAVVSIILVTVYHIDLKFPALVVAVILVCIFIVWRIYRVLYKDVPDGFVLVLLQGKGTSVKVLKGEHVPVLPWEKYEIRDIREKHYTHTFNCVTGDHISVALRIALRWQIDYEQLEAFYNLGIDATQILETLIGAQLAYDVFSRTLYKLQQDQRFIQFHLEQKLCWFVYSASLYGLIVQEPRIVSFSLPAAITALAEQAARNRIEQEIARSMRVISYHDRLIETQAMAQELQTLDHVIQLVAPRAVDFAETLQIARKWPEVGGKWSDKQSL